MSEPKAPGRVMMAIAFTDRCRQAEREAYRLGLGPMPVEYFGEPEWLRELRKQKGGGK